MPVAGHRVIDRSTMANSVEPAATPAATARLGSMTRIRRRTATPLRPSSFAVWLALVAGLVGLLLLPAAATAEPPSRLPSQVVDSANVLSAAERSEIEAALDRLYDERQIQLWVIFVSSFDGQTGQTWNTRTFEISGLSANDALLSVATEDRDFYLSAPQGIDGLSQSRLDAIGNDYTRPELRNDEWAAAAINTATGIDEAMTPSNTGLIVAGSLAGVVIVGGGGAVAYRRYRRRREVSEGIDALRDADALTLDQLAREPIEVLDPWSKEVLADTDNAVRTSEEELELATSEFGEAETAPFRRALDGARQALARSFELRQRLDDDIPETADEQRSMLVQIITTCSDADTALDEQVAAFDAMRNLLINADTRLDELTRQVVATTARLPIAEQQLAALAATHGEVTVSSIANNVELAREQVDFAQASADQGRAAAGAPVGSQGPAVAAIRSAEGALDQANRLLDAIANAERTIAAAQVKLPALIEEIESEVIEAEELRAHGGPDLAAAVAAAREALAKVRGEKSDDLLGSMNLLIEVDATLDDALAAARDASEARERRRQLLDSSLTSAEAKVSAAADFISTRRGAIQATARTRLSEAQRLFAEARDLAATDDAKAIDSARRAGSLADQALMAAQGDVVRWSGDQNNIGRPQQRGTGMSPTGAVLTGILVDSFLRGSRGGHRGGYRGGGYSSGGRSPGSFGGSGSSGRIGTGGRF